MITRTHLLGSIGLIACAGLLGCGGGDARTADPAASAAVADPSVSATAMASTLGAEVVMPDVRWTVSEVRPLGRTLASPTGAPARRTRGTFVLVRYDVTNAGREPRVMAIPPRIEADGNAYTALPDEADFLPPGLATPAFEALPPGVTRSYGSVFELPASTQTSAVVVHSLSLAGVEQRVGT